jgi:hypothetical protein
MSFSNKIIFCFHLTAHFDVAVFKFSYLLSEYFKIPDLSQNEWRNGSCELPDVKSFSVSLDGAVLHEKEIAPHWDSSTTSADGELSLLCSL